MYFTLVVYLSLTCHISTVTLDLPSVGAGMAVGAVIAVDGKEEDKEEGRRMRTTMAMMMMMMMTTMMMTMMMMMMMMMVMMMMMKVMTMDYSTYLMSDDIFYS